MEYIQYEEYKQKQKEKKQEEKKEFIHTSIYNLRESKEYREMYYL